MATNNQISLPILVTFEKLPDFYEVFLTKFLYICHCKVISIGTKILFVSKTMSFFINSLSLAETIPLITWTLFTPCRFSASSMKLLLVPLQPVQTFTKIGREREWIPCIYLNLSAINVLNSSHIHLCSVQKHLNFAFNGVLIFWKLITV